MARILLASDGPQTASILHANGHQTAIIGRRPPLADTEDHLIWLAELHRCVDWCNAMLIDTADPIEEAFVVAGKLLATGRIVFDMRSSAVSLIYPSTNSSIPEVLHALGGQS